MNVPVCRACGSPRTRLRGTRRGRTLPTEFSFHACADCGLLFVEPFAGFELYDDAYYRGKGPDPFVDYETEYRDWRATDRRLELADLHRLAGEHLRGDVGRGPVRWLDFGCGAGALLKSLRDRGSVAGRPLELAGHDVGSYANLLRDRDGFRILDLEQLAAEPPETYDIVSMIEVIEHLPAPLEPLRAIARLLRPGGLLLLTTGNLDCPVARRQGLDFGYCVPEIHVSLFNPAALGRLYRAVGLEPRIVRYRDTVRFKALKNLRFRPGLRLAARALLTLPPVVRLIDALYGVSAMPCAVKPAATP
ncbi:MAG: class I SAM-dependent methyltransferase [Opitutaceae bacterium]